MSERSGQTQYGKATISWPDRESESLDALREIAKREERSLAWVVRKRLAAVIEWEKRHGKAFSGQCCNCSSDPVVTTPRQKISTLPQDPAHSAAVDAAAVDNRARRIRSAHGGADKPHKPGGE